MQTNFNKDTVILLLSTLLIAFCGLLYELLIGSSASYLLGSSVKQFSFTIGAFMTAFGVGSYISKYFKTRIVRTFFIVELIIGFLGSISTITLFYFYSVSELFHYIMYFFIISIGALVGLEIPLIGRIIDDIKRDIRLTLANLLSFDYIGAMIGSILLPLVLLPQLGLIKSAIVVGLGNLFVAFLVGLRFRKKLSKFLLFLPLVLIGFDIVLIINARKIQAYIEQKFYDDRIIYQQRSRFQKIILTKDQNDVRLFLDGNIQFSSRDEHRYHEALVHVPILCRKGFKPVNVLILGGGDGLAARELLKHKIVKSITICDLDPAITDLGKKNPYLLKMNKHALSNEKVNIINLDAFMYLKDNVDILKSPKVKKKFKQWDLIIVDLPDPNNEALAKLYSVKFYKLVKACLSPDGVAVTQSTSPFHARKVYWCIYNTIKYSGFKNVLTYKANVPAFGVWGFIAFSKADLNIPNQSFPDIKLKYLNNEILPSLFAFPSDILKVKTGVNKVFRPIILDYYENSWHKY